MATRLLRVVLCVLAVLGAVVTFPYFGAATAGWLLIAAIVVVSTPKVWLWIFGFAVCIMGMIVAFQATPMESLQVAWAFLLTLPLLFIEWCIKRFN